MRDVGDMGQAQYRDAWAWTHFMLHGSAEARDELIRFLADLQAHSPPGLLSQRLQIDAAPRFSGLLGEKMKNADRPRIPLIHPRTRRGIEMQQLPSK